MGLLDTIVRIAISLQTKAVPKASFSIPLIIGATVPTWSGRVKAYTDPEDMLDDGYTTSSLEYKYAVLMYSQDVTPTQFFVGRRDTAVKQVDAISFTTVNTHLYRVTVDGVNYDYTSDADATLAEITAGLLALINADTNAPCVATGATSLTLTAKVFGEGFSTSINADPNMVLTHPTANYGIVDDLTLIRAENDTWYGVCICSNEDYDIYQMAAAIEALKKVFLCVSDNSDIPTAVTTDILSILKGLGYDRTLMMYSEDANEGKEAGWMGGQLPQTPGSNTWAFKSIDGGTPDDLESSEILTIVGNAVAQVPGKNGNVYTTVGGVPITMYGITVGGQFLDITIGIDWLEATIQNNIYTALVNSAKIPYTDKGTDILIQAVKSAIDEGVTNGLIDGDSEISVTAPKVLDVPINQRANRVAPTISFKCRLQGAVHAVDVEGSVTV